MSSRARFAVLIASVSTAYAVIAAGWTWPLAMHPGDAVVQLKNIPPQWRPVLFYDQLLTIAGTARNATSIIQGSFSHLLDTGLCYPFPHPASLGEHMIELGLLAAPFRLLSANPVLLHNITLLTSFLLSGLGMFAWVYFWTGCGPAAAVAGMALAVHPARLADLPHPAVVAVHWIPFVLLFFDRLLERGRIRDAVFLAVAASLQVVTGAYPLLTATLLLGVYGAVRLVQQRRRLDRARLISLAAAVLFASATAAAVLVPYAHLQTMWALLRPRAKFFVDARDLVVGNRASLGLAMPLAACVALAAYAWDRRRALYTRKRKEFAPRRRPPLMALALAGIVCTSFSVRGSLWDGGPSIPSLQAVMVTIAPLIGSVRVPAAVFLGTTVVVTALGGLALARLATPLRGPSTFLLTSAAACAIAAETFVPGVARVVHGREFATELRPLSANPDELAAYNAVEHTPDRGPVLDIPFPISLGRGIQFASHYTFLAAYYDVSTAACYNSFNPPTQSNLSRIAARLPDTRAIQELQAAGIRELVVHRNWVSPSLETALRKRSDVTVLVQTRKATALRLTRAPSTHHDRSRLAAVSLQTPSVFTPAVKAKDILAQFVRIGIRNNDARVWAQPRPLRPLRTRLTWYDAETGLPTKVTELRLLLPLALAGGAVDEIPLNVTPYPQPGSYRLELDIEEMGVKLRAPSEVRVRL